MTIGEQLYEIVVDANLPVRMRDGTILRADVFRPNAQERFPGLLYRTPYDKRRSDDGLTEVYAPIGREAAAHGYVVALQDVRGRFASDGEFFPFFSRDHRDTEDGYDTVEWLATLPYCNGRVGTFGDSYGAWTQWELAQARPPQLVAMLPSGLPAVALEHPVFRVGRRILWLIARMAPETFRRQGSPAAGPSTASEAYAHWEGYDRGKWYWYLPWRELPEEVLGDLAPHFRRWLDLMPYDYLGYERKHHQVAVPALHVTGWFDISVGGSIRHYTGMVRNAMTEHARRHQQLLIGPWNHMDPYYDLPRRTGEVDFGPGAEADYVHILLRWFDYWLKGLPNGVTEEPPIKLFVMGDNVWRHEHEWPLARTVYTDLYLRSGGAANTPAGDGRLHPVRPGTEPADSYVYNPRDPVMSIFSRGAYYEPRDQQPLDYRRDVLVFVGDPLAREIEVTGPITVELWAASTAADTDFTAKLVDVSPSGKAIGLCAGIVRARYRESVEKPSLITPGAVYRYRIELEPTAWVFKAGHRIRLDVSSSDFPNYDRNHNTGANDFADDRLVPARQTVFHDSTSPSRLILPVIPR
ncbi:MAG: CocE/NonD family hydrolase [Chloroflexi bacterium]|nr:CocE/NonD family hydrolase [Chloroflexota bacterium]